MNSVRVLSGDCLAVLPTLEPESMDAVICDPPYHLTAGKKGGSGEASVNLESPYGRARIGTGFMGKRWDGGDVAFQPETWAAVLRVAKPGAHLLACGGTRTWHRLACAIEDAGWEIRDNVAWLFGSGFPKSLNVGQGRGTALKPGHEPIVLARKPLIGTVAANVERYGTGALNIDACRIGVDVVGWEGRPSDGIRDTDRKGLASAEPGGRPVVGRWPANVMLDEEAAQLLDEQAPSTGGSAPASGPTHRGYNKSGSMAGHRNGMGDREPAFCGDSGGASRFYYCAKASRGERDAGLTSALNNHPTVKPIALMRWLCRLVTPPRGVVLDPFCGSGSTGCAAVLEGLSFVGIEREAEYVGIAEARIRHWAAQRDLTLFDQEPAA